MTTRIFLSDPQVLSGEYQSWISDDALCTK